MASELNFDIGYPVTDKNPYGDPLPTQEKFHQSSAKYRFLVGGWGTGKTKAGIIECAKDITIPNNYILFSRKYEKVFSVTTLQDFLEFYEPLQVIAGHNKQEGIITFINGTKLIYMNLDESREAFTKIATLNLGAVYVDQGEEITENIFHALRGRLRRDNTRRIFVGMFNAEGHNWQYNLAKVVHQPNLECWEATSYENIYLPDDYIAELKNYPERIYKRYVMCSYDDFTGLVYDEFTNTVHLIEPYEPQAYEQRYIILDYGFRNPTSLGFWSVDYDGIARRYNEWYHPGKLVYEIAERIKQELYWQRALLLADPSVWNVQRDGKSIADEFLEYGVAFQPADNSVIQGVNRVNTLFKENKLYICRNCIEWIREQGNYKWKELKPGQIKNEYEEPVKKDDHAMDETRYFVNYIYAPLRPKQETVVHPNSRQAVVPKQNLTTSKYAEF